MSPFWGGILIGVFIGSGIGIIAAGLLAAAKCGECGERIELWLAKKAG